MRTFDHFPANTKCPLCGSNDDKPCFLAGIDNTAKGNIEQAQPVHVACLTSHGAQYRWNLEMGCLYRFINVEDMEANDE